MSGNNKILRGPVLEYIVSPRHVGLLCDDIEATLIRLQTIFSIDDHDILRIPEGDEPCDTRFAFFSIAELKYELIQPVSEHYKQLLSSSNRGANHVCYTVSDLPAAVAAMKTLGVRLGHVTADGMVTAPQFRMAYFNPDDTGGLLIEFIEDLASP